MTLSPAKSAYLSELRHEYGLDDMSEHYQRDCIDDAERRIELDTTHDMKVPSAAEAERLYKLAEECNEVGKEVMKVLRHGYESHHPADPARTNRERLNDELTDLSATLLDMRNKGDLPALDVISVKGTLERKRKYDHFQP